jgi:hypothetical protein
MEVAGPGAAAGHIKVGVFPVSVRQKRQENLLDRHQPYFGPGDFSRKPRRVFGGADRIFRRIEHAHAAWDRH